MSANRTRFLLADDTDLLARARTGIVSRPEYDVVMAASTDEALQVVSDVPPPGVIVLPADGAIDGLQVCRAVKAGASARAFVLLALPADATAKRDACFAAGADDVLFAPIEAADLASRLDRTGAAIRAAPRAEVELVVRLANPTGNAVIDSKGLQISREAVAVTLPTGTSSPANGMLVRAVFTLYEGGTLQVWARVASSADGRTVLRFVGLTETERRAIDYFVDFYLKRTGATAQPAPTGGSPEDLLLSAQIPEAPEGPNALSFGDTIRQIADATLDEIAEAGSRLASGRPASVPSGFDASRVRALLPKLSNAESSALRGTTMYNNILVDLRKSAAARIRLMEMTVVVKEGGFRLDRRTTEQIVLGSIAEAQQIHNSLDAGFQDLIRAGNTAAMRDLQPVKSGLLTACVELKTALDKDVLGKESAEAPGKLGPTAPKHPTKYTADPAAKSEKATKDSLSKEKEKSKSTGSATSAPGRRIAVSAVLVVLAGGAIWSNVPALSGGGGRQQIFRPDNVLFEKDGIRVWTSTADPATSTVTWIVDSSWELSSEEARKAALEEMAARSAGSARMVVVDYRSQQLAERKL